MRLLTWGDLKAIVESVPGVTDDTTVWVIRVECPRVLSDSIDGAELTARLSEDDGLYIVN